MTTLITKRYEKFNHILGVELPSKLLGGSFALEFSDFIKSLPKENLRFVILNFKQVDSVNSSGLGMLVSAYTSLKKDSIELVLVNVPQKVSHLLQITHLDRIFQIYPSEEDFISTIARQ